MSKLNISRETNALLKRLQLEPTFVKELVITPTTVTATVYKRHPDTGAKYVEPVYTDGHGEVTHERVALDTVEFEVRT